MDTDLTAILSRLDRLEQKRIDGLSNYQVQRGAGIMPSKLSAALNTGQSAALISGNTNLEQDIQSIVTFANALVPGSAGALVYSNGTKWLTNTAGTSGMATLSGGSGAPTYGTLGLTYGGSGADLSAMATGALAVKNSTSSLIALAQGTSGQVFLSAGAGANPTWGTAGLTYGGTGADLSSATTNALIKKASTSNLTYSGVIVDSSNNVSGIGTLATSGTINGQTISSAASFTGTMAIAGALTVSKSSTSSFDSYFINSNTGNSAHSNLHIKATAVASTSGGNSVLSWHIDNVESWEMGLDYSAHGASPVWKLVDNSANFSGGTLIMSAISTGVTVAGTLNIGNRPAFATGDKYLVVDASGNVHVSALGPAS